MRLNIRPFDYTDRDYEAAVQVNNRVWPIHKDTVERWKFFDERRPDGYLFERHVAEVDGRLVAEAGIGETPGSYEPGKYWLAVTVDPDYRRRGIGSALYEHLLARINGRELHKLTSWTREDQAEGIRFLEQRGFQQVMRAPMSQLDLATFDAAPFAAKVQRIAEAEDLRVYTLAQLLEQDPDCKTRLYQAMWEFLQDVPRPDPLTQWPRDVWEQRIFESPHLLPDGWFIAVAGDRYVGLTMLWRGGDEERLETGLTGVARSHRRRGLATALKVQAIHYAQQHGYRRIITDNEENNPMFQINLQLGFKPLPAGLDFTKHITN